MIINCISNVTFLVPVRLFPYECFVFISAKTSSNKDRVMSLPV